MLNDATSYKAGDIPKASEFMFSFSDGSTKTISAANVSLTDAWYQPLYVGENRLAIVYRGTTYYCVISASDASDGTSDDSDDIVMDSTQNDSSNTMDNTNTENDNNNDVDDDIVID